MTFYQVCCARKLGILVIILLKSKNKTFITDGEILNKQTNVFNNDFSFPQMSVYNGKYRYINERFTLTLVKISLRISGLW